MNNYKVTDLGIDMMIRGKLKISPANPESQGTSLTRKWKVWYDGIRVDPQEKKLFFIWEGNEVMEIDFSSDIGNKWAEGLSVTVDGIEGIIPLELRT